MRSREARKNDKDINREVKKEMTTPTFTTIVIAFTVLFDRQAITLPKAKRLFRQSVAIIQRDAPVTISAKRFQRVRGVPRLMLQHQNFALGVYFSFFPVVPEGEKVILLAPPGQSTQSPKTEYAIGQASICGPVGYIGVVKQGHWMINVVGLAHEMGHMLGARHTPDDDSLMNPAPVLAAYFRDWNVFLSDTTRQEIEECTRPVLRAL